MSSSTHVLGRSVPRLEDRAAAHRARPVRRRYRFPAPAAHAHRALALCPCRAALRRRRGGAGRAGSRRGVDRRRTSPTCRRSIFATRPPRRCAPIASRCWRASGCAMSASRSRRCSRPMPISPRTPPSWSRSRPTSWRRCSMPRRRPAASRPGFRPRRWCCAPVTAMSRQPSPRRMRSSRSI